MGEEFMQSMGRHAPALGRKVGVALVLAVVAAGTAGCSRGYDTRFTGLRPYVAPVSLAPVSTVQSLGRPRTVDVYRTPPPAPPRLKVGKPYVIAGRTYVPRHDPNYDRTGIGSWYGPGFHGRKTANGETYDQNGFTAAHPTLPLNALVRVTNLENGRSLVLRINDRGPFVGNRIIDLSRAAADHLGYAHQGTARVRVQVVRTAALY